MKGPATASVGRKWIHHRLYFSMSSSGLTRRKRGSHERTNNTGGPVFWYSLLLRRVRKLNADVLGSALPTVSVSAAAFYHTVQTASTRCSRLRVTFLPFFVSERRAKRSVRSRIYMPDHNSTPLTKAIRVARALLSVLARPASIDLRDGEEFDCSGLNFP